LAPPVVARASLAVKVNGRCRDQQLLADASELRIGVGEL